MFREMRRKRQLLSEEETSAILYRGTSGVLSLAGDDGYPYGVPISYVYDGEKIYFHCAKSGHKLDAIRRKAKASFCVIDQDEIVPEKYTSRYRSAVVFGQIRMMEEEREKREAIEKLAVKYAPEDTAAGREDTIDRYWETFCTLEMRIHHMTGKEWMELVRERQKD